MFDLHPALDHRLGQRTGQRNIDRDHSGRSEIGIEALDQLQVDLALSLQIEFAFAGQMHCAGGGNIGVLAHQMELVDLEV